MNRSFLTAALGAFLLISAGCRKVTGEGSIQTEYRTVGAFSKVESYIGGTVQVVEGDTHTVTVSAQQDILDVLKTEIEDGSLVIRYKHNVRVSRSEDVSVTVHAPSFRTLKMLGAGKIINRDTLNSPFLTVDVNSSGSVHLNQVHAALLDAEIGGSGYIRVDGGRVTREVISIVGSGNIQLGSLPADEVKVRSYASGSANVYALRTLDVDILGSGSVYYSGTPSISVRVTGSGRLRAN